MSGSRGASSIASRRGPCAKAFERSTLDVFTPRTGHATRERLGVLRHDHWETVLRGCRLGSAHPARGVPTGPCAASLTGRRSPHAFLCDGLRRTSCVATGWYRSGLCLASRYHPLPPRTLGLTGSPPQHIPCPALRCTSALSNSSPPRFPVSSSMPSDPCCCVDKNSRPVLKSPAPSPIRHSEQARK